MRTIPSPGEKVGPEGGRKRNAGGNLKVSTTAQAYSRAGCKTIPRKKSVCYPRLNMIARIPLQSPIGSEEPIGDSFPPGEAMGAPAPEHLMHAYPRNERFRGIFSCHFSPFVL